jgi:hypothetical protein
MVFDPAGEDTPGRPPAADDGSLSVVVVDYRRPDLVADAVAALYRGDRTPDELVIVDVDADRPLELPPVPDDVSTTTRVVPLDGNPGYAAACNRGFAETSGDTVLFMNSDVIVGRTSLAAVAEAMSADPGLGIVTCRLVLPDGTLDHACHRGIPTPLDSLAYKTRLHRVFPGVRRFGRYTLAWLDPQTNHDIEACSGAFLAVRRDAFESVGGWDEGYWFYGEDLDLCLRVTQSGARIGYVGAEVVTHLKGSTSHLRRRSTDLTPEQQATRRRVQRAIVESHQRFYREHLEADTARPLRPLVDVMFAIQRRVAERDR